MKLCKLAPRVCVGDFHCARAFLPPPFACPPAEAYEEDQLRSAAEVQFFEDAVEQHVQRQRECRFGLRLAGWLVVDEFSVGQVVSLKPWAKGSRGTAHVRRQRELRRQSRRRCVADHAVVRRCVVLRPCSQGELPSMSTYLIPPTSSAPPPHLLPTFSPPSSRPPGDGGQRQREDPAQRRCRSSRRRVPGLVAARRAARHRRCVAWAARAAPAAPAFLRARALQRSGAACSILPQLEAPGRPRPLPAHVGRPPFGSRPET